MSIRFTGRRSRRLDQRRFAFLERAIRRERWFKRAIVLATVLVVLVLLRSLASGRYLVAKVETTTGRMAHRALGFNMSRDQINEEWRQFRQLGIETTRPKVEAFYAHCDPAVQRLMRYVGMDPEHGLLRWGNHDWTLLFSSKVFEADERRSYKFRPNMRSIWLKHMAFIAGTPAFYLVPDEPGLADACRGTDATPVEFSRQTTNSWGLRGLEPDPKAPLRGIVLGDSYMQGMFIGDEQTPPECLRRYLERELATRVSVLNTGVLGYSPEQYYYTLLEFADRFRPQFVVVSVFANDAGSEGDAASAGTGDWYEAEYWLDRIVHHCRDRHCTCLITAAPFEFCIFAGRNSGNYPGQLVNKLRIASQMFLDPMDDFLNAHLKAGVEAMRKGREPEHCTLFNDAIDDSHFSPAGSEVWAESVGRRLLLLMEHEELSRRTNLTLGQSTPEPSP